MSRLSPHFTLGEMVRSAHRSIDNRPPPEIVERLRLFCREFLEPVRQRFGALFVTSGYRCLELNTAIGGSRDSAHTYGCAADFVPLADGVTNREIVRWVAGPSGLLYDQVIDERSSTDAWVHLGSLRPGSRGAPRRSALVFVNGAYSPFSELLSG